MLQWSPANASVWRIVEAINHAWVHGPLTALQGLYYDAVVIVDRDGRQLARGRKEAVGLYSAFLEEVEPLSFEPFEPAIHADVVGGTAVAQYRFETTYRRAGQERKAVGRDLLVLTYANNGWQVLWRQVYQDEVDSSG